MILGYGGIGSQVAKLGKAFGMRVTGIRRNPQDDEHADENHESLSFEVIGLSSGSTAFTLLIMHDGHADYTSMPILVNVVEREPFADLANFGN